MFLTFNSGQLFTQTACHFLYIVLSLWGIFGISHAYAGTAEVTGVRVWQAPDNTRLVLDLSEPVRYEIFTLDNPFRVVLDIQNARVASGLKLPNLASTSIQQMRFGVQPNQGVRLVLDIAHLMTPKAFVLAKQGGKSDRLVLDLFEINPKTKQDLSHLDAPLSSARTPVDNSLPNYTSLPTPSPSASISLSKLRSSSGSSMMGKYPVPSPSYKPPRNSQSSLVTDTSSSGPTLQPLKEVIPPPEAPLPDINVQLEPVSKTSAPGGRKWLIAVDAGHGGEDPGAMGPGKVQEKAVVLDISKNLVTRINQQPGYKAFLVRTGDYYIPLNVRRDKARKMRADLFVSIHADAFKNPQAGGASVFALSQRGATSETARFLAQQENNADLIGGVGDVNLEDVDKVVAGVLVDLSMTATMATSMQVGDRVLRELGRMTKLHKRHVEQAGFMVLKSPDVPSILVETGFISNPNEARLLSQYAHRQRLANAIFNGIHSYFNGVSNPLPSMSTKPKLATQQRVNSVSKPFRTPPNAGKETLYKVKPGDTLSDIATQHSLTTSKLLNHNKLKKSDHIRVGQVLRVPAP